MQEDFLEERGIWYSTNGGARAPAIVFIHGLTGSSSAWHEYEEKFAATHRIIFYDLRGHGRSVKPKRYEDYEMQQHVDDLKALLSHLSVERCTLVSHSYGTLIALECILQSSASVEKAIFISPTFDLRTIRLQRFSDSFIRTLCRIFAFFPIRSAHGRHVDYGKYRHTGDWNFRRMWADIRNTGLRVSMFCLDILCASEDPQKWKKLDMPVHIIHGSKDSVIPLAHAQAMATSTNGAELTIIDGANHVLVINDAADVSAALEHILNAISSTISHEEKFAVPAL